MVNDARTIFVPFVRAFGGVERLVISLANDLHRRNLPHRVVCFEDTIDLASFSKTPINVCQLRPTRSAPVEAWRLHQVVAGDVHRPLFFDLKGGFYASLANIHGYVLHLTDPPSLLPADVSKYAFSLGRRSSSWTVRLRGELAHRVNRRGVRNAHAVVTMTHRIAGEVNSLYAVESHVIRPGVALPAQRRSSIAPSARMLSISRLEKSKRLDWLLIALRERPSWQLDLVGDGPARRELELLCENLAIVARVVFHGRVSDERLEELYGQATVFVMPAVQGYGLPALEALARGVPVVLHRESGVAEILGDSPWALVTDGSESELVSALDAMSKRLSSGELEITSCPHVPSESDWAAKLGELLGWH